MWRVKYGDQYLHDPVGDDYALTDIRMGMELNTSGWCKFSLPNSHPLKSEIKSRDRSNPVEVWLDDEMMWAGWVYEKSTDYWLTGNVSCKGEMAYLGDVRLRPYSTISGKYALTAPSEVDAYFSWLIDQYNRSVDSSRRFEVGVNHGAALDRNNHIFRESAQLPKVADEIQDKLLDKLGGYLFVRYEHGIRYIDYLSECQDVNAQVIDFGVNLLDFVRTDTASGLCTAVVPRGKDGLTVESLGDGPYSGDPDFYIEGDRIVNRAAAQEYGVIEMAYENSDIETAFGLAESAVAALRPSLEPKVTIELKLVDMAMMAVGKFRPLRVGEFVRVRSKPHGFDGYMLVTKLEPDLLDPSQSLYTLGTTFDSLTGETNRKIRELNASIVTAYDKADSLGEDVKAAADMAASAVQEAYEEYAVSASRTEKPSEGASWSREAPSAGGGMFVWRRTVSKYGDGTTVTSEAVPLTGESAASVEITTTDGSVIRNKSGSTVMQASVMYGGDRIGDLETLQAYFGAGACLQWSEGDDGAFAAIGQDDPRLSDDGFSLKVSASDIDGDSSYICALITTT